MTLRATLQATVGGKVARRAPQATQRATSAPERATGYATTAQQPAADPRECSAPSATDRATGAQLPSCAALGGDRLEVARVDADRWCWPHSPAMNTGEIETFVARLARFIGIGMQAGAGEALADRLVVRDRDGDDRVSCAECRHGRATRCPNVAPLPPDVLHRCTLLQKGNSNAR